MIAFTEIQTDLDRILYNKVNYRLLSNTLLSKPASRERSMEPLIIHVPIEKAIRRQETLSFVTTAFKRGATRHDNGQRVR